MKKMKRILVMIMVLALLLTSLTGCDDYQDQVAEALNKVKTAFTGEEVETEEVETEEVETEEVETEKTETEDVKTEEIEDEEVPLAAPAEEKSSVSVNALAVAIVVVLVCLGATALGLVFRKKDELE
mgnify:CR=1 FL=1